MPFTTKQIAIARAAGALAGLAFDPSTERNGEQANAFAALLAAFNGDATQAAACYAQAAQADAVKRATRKPEPKPEPKPEAKAEPKPEQPSKPHADAKRDDYEARVKLIGELRASVARFYNGPSLAVRTNPKRKAASDYEALFVQPKHRTTLDKISIRDESGLALIIERGDRSGCFDPAAINFDLGIFSRLRSVSFIEAAPLSSKLPYRLSKAGAEHARKAASKAA